ncbi:MAG: UDP-3-O-[3-hydroxymyristoyl] glucosamine N-acyltransferase [Verrucomicrobiota bacterium]
MTLAEIAKAAGGKPIGDPAIEITGAASLAEATAGEISFFGNPKYAAQLKRTQASAIFVAADFDQRTTPAQIRVANPAKAFEQVVLRFAPKPVEFAPGVHANAIVDLSAKLGRDVSIQPCAVVEAGASIGDRSVVGAGTYIGHGSSLGADCKIYPNVTIRERTKIGDRVIIHSGAVIGADGFGFELVEGKQQKVPQLGIVQIDDDVEIGANTTIDRARFGRTWIQQGVKIDNLVQVAHNVVIGRGSIIVAQVGIAGSSRLGENVTLAGQAGVVGHVEIGDRVIVAAQSGIPKDLPADSGVWLGSPAVKIRNAREQIALIHKLGKLVARLKAIEKKLGLS